MSFKNLVIRDVEGERSFGSDMLPLRVGTGNDCQLRLPGPGGEPVALLDLLDGAPIVQPVGRNASLRINDAALDASRRLVDRRLTARVVVNDDRRIPATSRERTPPAERHVIREHHSRQ